MKHRVMLRAAAVGLEHDVRDGRGVATAGTSASRPRQGPTVSEAIFNRLVAGFDTAAIFAAGAPLHHNDSVMLIPTMPPWHTGCARRSTTYGESAACKNALSRLAVTVSTG